MCLHENLSKGPLDAEVREIRCLTTSVPDVVMKAALDEEGNFEILGHVVVQLNYINTTCAGDCGFIFAREKSMAMLGFVPARGTTSPDQSIPTVKIAVSGWDGTQNPDNAEVWFGSYSCQVREMERVKAKCPRCGSFGKCVTQVFEPDGSPDTACECEPWQYGYVCDIYRELSFSKNMFFSRPFSCY